MAVTIESIPKPHGRPGLLETISVQEFRRLAGGMSRSTFNRVVKPTMRLIQISDRKTVIPLSDVQRWFAARTIDPFRPMDNQEGEWDETDEEIGGFNHG